MPSLFLKTVSLSAGLMLWQGSLLMVTRWLPCILVSQQLQQKERLIFLNSCSNFEFPCRVSLALIETCGCSPAHLCGQGF